MSVSTISIDRFGITAGLTFFVLFFFFLGGGGGGQMWRRNDVIIERRLSSTSFCGKTLCFVPPKIESILRMFQRQSRSYPETVNIHLLCGKIPCDGVHRHQKARVWPCGYQVFTGIQRQRHVRYEYRYRYLQVTLSEDWRWPVGTVYGFGSRGLCFVFTTATRCAWENNNFDINTRSNNAFKEKDPSLVYLFIFFIYNHASIC